MKCNYVDSNKVGRRILNKLEHCMQRILNILVHQKLRILNDLVVNNMDIIYIHEIYVLLIFEKKSISLNKENFWNSTLSEKKGSPIIYVRWGWGEARVFYVCGRFLSRTVFLEGLGRGWGQHFICVAWYTIIFPKCIKTTFFVHFSFLILFIFKVSQYGRVGSSFFPGMSW